MEPLLTERLCLRCFTEQDYEDLYEFLSQRRDEQFEAYPGITYENGRQHLAYRLGNDDFLAIELRSTGRVIGNIYRGKRDFCARELGYIVNKNDQRHGYASEAIRAVLQYEASQGLHRVYAECDPRNECSWRLLESLGFEREARLRQNVYFRTDENGAPLWQDTYVYGMLLK